MLATAAAGSKDNHSVSVVLNELSLSKLLFGLASSLPDGDAFDLEPSFEVLAIFENRFRFG